MFPMEFDYTMLESLPLPTAEDIKRVTLVLRAIITKRILPHFRKKRGTDPLVVARVGDQVDIKRLEDENNVMRGVSAVTGREQRGIIHIHERVFDYLAFVIPGDPEASLGHGTPEERKMLAFSEFMLRHELELLLYPKCSERDAIGSDVAFAMDRRANDPTFYRTLRLALTDEMNGLKGRDYASLLDMAEQEISYEAQISRILTGAAEVLGDLRGSLLRQVFPALDKEMKAKLIGVCYRRSRDVSSSLVTRTSCLMWVLRFFSVLVDTDETEAKQVFETFKDSWGLVYLLQELELSASALEGKPTKEIFELFKDRLKLMAGDIQQPEPVRPIPVTPAAPTEPKTKGLKDRIEEARNDPAFPVRVMEIIDKNKLNAAGHSGYKYSELIETLLAIPWGVIKRIEVTPEDFERGLNSTHYGLEKPKEMLCDFFANLIWRYQGFTEKDASSWRRNGSSFLFVGPPGVGKTSLAISIAENLGVPYHKLSLGGMRDEADLRGHGFTYEGSKPGAIVQGIIKMGILNGMFIMDEADKTEKFAVATLLEILDPEQNHIFHDKYTQTTVDIDLSNCHFILTANTLETVPAPVINRCEVVMLDRYSVQEKVCIAQQHLIKRIRQRHHISEDQVRFDPDQEADLLRHLVKTYTYEAGVRELERLIRTLFLRIMRKEILTGEQVSVKITRERIKQYLDPPKPPRSIGDEDRIGEALALGVNVERGVGSIIPVQATPIHVGGDGREDRGFLSVVQATGNIEKVMDESRKVALTAILDCAGPLGIDPEKAKIPIHLHFMGGSTPKDGPSAGGAIGLALASALSGNKIRRDVAMTGEIDTHGRITEVGGLDVKLESAYDAGCRTVIIPSENLYGPYGIERLSDALKEELYVLTFDEWQQDHEPLDVGRHEMQVVAVDHILQAAQIAFLYQEELQELESIFVPHARRVADELRKKPEAAQAVPILYLKALRDLHMAQDGDTFWERSDCVFLVLPGEEQAFRRRFPRLDKERRLWAFDATIQDLSGAIEQILGSMRSEPSQAIRVALFAPYFSLMRDRNSLENLSRKSRISEMTLLATNYAFQGFKIKGSKPVLNRVYAHLCRLSTGQLDECPFIKRLDGIYVPDLCFIPEKYRLDEKRAERIFVAALTRWLDTLESQVRRGPFPFPLRGCAKK